MIEKLEKISISAEKTEKYQLSEGIVSYVLQPRQILTRSQSEKTEIPPFEILISYFQKKSKKYESQISTSDILSKSPPQTPSFPSLIATASIPTTGASSSSASTQYPSSSTQTPSISSSTQTPLIISSTQSPMAGQQPPPRVQPWNNPDVVAMAAPLHPLPKHPKRWLPKSNPNDQLLPRNISITI